MYFSRTPAFRAGSAGEEGARPVTLLVTVPSRIPARLASSMASDGSGTTVEVGQLNTELFYPKAKRDPAPDDGGSMLDVPIRGVLHTTEGRTFAAHRSAIAQHNSWPHFSCTFEHGKFEIFQHIPINRAARALKANGPTETNQANAIQIEIVGICNPPDMNGGVLDVPRFPRAYLAGIAEWMRWVEEHGVKRQATVAFKAPPANGVRLSPAAWMAYNGWLGHQHVPENDHTDPGAIDIATLLGEEDIDMATGDEIMAALRALRQDLTVFGNSSLKDSTAHSEEHRHDTLKKLTNLERTVADLATKVQVLSQQPHG